jgi:hypothetical protein
MFSHHEHHEEEHGKASGRKTANPGFYNKRFEPSQGIDGNYFENNAYFRGAEGSEPK